ncbi:sigma-70 family RNA polymerase sigma factor [Synechocystis sp. LEGE 06083]|nr:sigma-70 family RNA polymerase sigma factor [Synechocystis sp. LEGE 06083]MBE9194520.1 sigma-70 family RNA polymerase sigma factor [Synechocystis sp. LEGE 06083]
MLVKPLVNPAVGENEASIIQQSQQGDAEAFRQLYRRYQAKVRSTLYQLCGQDQLDDLVQEVFFKVWKGLPKLRNHNFFATWLYRITWNVAQDARKQLGRSRQRIHQPSSALADNEGEISLQLSRPEDSPDLLQLHYQDLVQQGLATLSFEHRTVLVLHDLEDLPQKTIAEVLNLPGGTIKSRLFYARRAMREFLQQQGVQDVF